MKKQSLKSLAFFFFLGLSLQSGLAIDWSKDTLKINIQHDPGTVGNGGFIGADVPDAPEGYLIDNGTVYADKGNGFTYGWDMDISSSLRYRINAADVSETDFRRLSLCHLQKGSPATWEIALPAGKYNVFLCGGDAINAVDFTNSFSIEGTVVEDETPLTRGFDELTATVDVSDGNLTICPAEGLGVNTKLCYILISKEVTAPAGLSLESKDALDVTFNRQTKSITICRSQTKENCRVEIYSASGVLIGQKICTSEKTSFSLPAMKSGLYLLKCTQGRNIINRKLML